MVRIGVFSIGALLLSATACKSRDAHTDIALSPAVRNEEVKGITWTAMPGERALCPWTDIRMQVNYEPRRPYLCALVSHAWAVLDTSRALRVFAITDTTGRPTLAEVDVARVDLPEVPKEERSVRWVVIFPSTHADSAGISVGIDSASGVAQVYRHVSFLRTRPGTPK
jgi:hypothetical protein